MKSKPNTIILILIFIIIVLPFVVMLCAPKVYETRSQFLLGTFVEVTACDYRAFDTAFAEMARVNSIFDMYDPHSDLYRLNTEGKLKLPNEIAEVLQISKNFTAETNGAFDVSAGNLFQLWKDSIKFEKLPEENNLQQARKKIGLKNVQVDRQNSQIFLSNGIKLDFGGIAAGYAVDCAVRKLKEAGIKSCLINAGGDIYCLGRKAGKLWKIGIRHPRKPDAIIKEIELENMAITTSGDYEKYVIIDNVRYSHIINPLTGYPADSGVVSSTVISPECINADALATSVFVLGKEEGLKLIKKYKDTQAIIYTKEDLGVSDN